MMDWLTLKCYRLARLRYTMLLISVQKEKDFGSPSNMLTVYFIVVRHGH